MSEEPIKAHGTYYLEPAVAELMKRKVEWSNQMALDCIVQAIRCGDFVRLIQGDKEAVVYLPFERVTRLEQTISEQKETISLYRDYCGDDVLHADEYVRLHRNQAGTQ
jgi:hypothetical protein